MLSQSKQTLPNKNHPDFISMHNHCLGNIYVHVDRHIHVYTGTDVWLQISVLWFRKLLMCLTNTQTQADRHTYTHTHSVSGWGQQSGVQTESLSFFPLLCECYSDWGAAGWSMCLLREILFTGINAFYTQASVGTLSGGLLPAGTCEGSLWSDAASPM